MKNTLQTFELNQEVALQGSLVELDQIDLEQVSGGILKGIISGIGTDLILSIGQGVHSGYRTYVDSGQRINHSVCW